MRSALSCFTKPEDDDAISDIHVDNLSADDLAKCDVDDLSECNAFALNTCVWSV